MIYRIKIEGKEEEAAKYRDYFDVSESLKRCTSHRPVSYTHLDVYKRQGSRKFG